NQIVANEWYSANNLTEFNNTDNLFALVCSSLTPDGIYTEQFPCEENEDVGVIEIKAAWMVLPEPIPAEIESEYYTTTRTFLVDEARSINDTEREVTVPVALIGFHIVHKTSRQAWVWTTFEHVGNAPDANNLPSSGSYNLYNSNCQENCQQNQPYAKEPYLWRDEFPHAVTIEDSKIKQQIPSQITRLIPITATAQLLNSDWQEELRKVDSASIWQNYQLIGTQWLGSPAVAYEPSLRDVQPRQGNQASQLANVTLEPYVQKTEIGSSCIACHTHAHLPTLNAPPEAIHADFSFLLGRAESPTEVNKAQ
ncbi:MAG: hypothetical protein F6K24_45685, partial [Okeania sp. SIO2D1]|nr:hypothetical protein [Okeania sp. SIO2D1]